MLTVIAQTIMLIILLMALQLLVMMIFHAWQHAA
jgi:hypothetical protein